MQQCGIGLIEVRIDDDRLAFRAPPLLKTGPLSPAELAEALRVSGADPKAVVEAVHVANGPGWQLLRLSSADAVLAAVPSAKAHRESDVGLAGPYLSEGLSGSVADWELRAFFVDELGHVVEDPVTGSFNAGVAQHLFASGLARGNYVAAQGRKTGADGLIHCSIDASGSVWIGGRVATIAGGGTLAL